MARKFDAEQCIILLNELRVQLNSTPFTEKMIREGFKSCKIPSNALFWSVFRSSGIVKQIGDNLYCFIKPEKPIYFRMLQEIYKKYKDKSDQYHDKWYTKKRRKNTLDSPEVQAAIKLLNECGFEVIKRIVLNK